MKVKIYYPIITAITFFLLCNLTFAQWTQLADIPTARCMASSCTLDGKMYVIGGTESTSSVGTMEVYDPFLDSWDTTKTDMPTSRVELGACAVNGKIYAIGGATNHSASPLGMVEEYDTLTNTWDTNKMPMPTPRKGAAYGVIDNIIYVAGGTALSGWTASNKLEIYDPVTDTWVDTLATMDYEIYAPQGAVINDKFYVIGGLIGSPWTGQKIVQMYDPIIDTWSRIADLDSGRVGHTANGVAGKIYAIGGERQPPLIRNVEEYDPISNTWTVINQTPDVMNSHTASVFENKIYVFSGSTTPLSGGFTPTDAVYSFDPSYLDTIYVPGDYATIQEAINVALNGNTILVDEDTYYENINFKGKAITVASHFLTDGDSTHIENTIIDGSQPTNPDTASVVCFFNGEDSTSVLCGFTIRGGTGTVEPQYTYRSGGAIYIDNAAATIKNNIIESNTILSSNHVAGGAISCNVGGRKTLVITNNVIRENIIETTRTSGSAHGGGIGIFVNGDSAIVRISNNNIQNNQTNTTSFNNGGGIALYGYDFPNFIGYVNSNRIVGNKVSSNVTQSYGGGMTVVNANALIENNIIAYNTCYEAAGIDNANLSGQNSPQYINNTICYNTAVNEEGGISTFHIGEMINCIVWGNEPTQFTPWSQLMSITYSNVGEDYTGQGNITEDPLFTDTSFFLMDMNSLCIDAGNPDPMYNDVEDPQSPGNPLWPALGTLANDMGHCGGPNSLWSFWDIPVSVENDETENGIPVEFTLSQNYPNPFNPTTTIVYGLIERTNVELKLFDVLGREVETIVNREQDAGYYEVEFNASRLASGIYFYRLQAGDFIETKKMVLLR